MQDLATSKWGLDDSGVPNLAGAHLKVAQCCTFGAGKTIIFSTA